MSNKTFLSFASAAGLLASAVCMLATPVEVSIPWEQDWPVVSPAGAEGFGFTLTNTGTEPMQVTFRATLESPSGQAGEVAETVTLQAGGEQLIPWSLSGREMGVWTAEYTVQSEEGEQSRKVQFGYLDPVGPNATHPEFLLGVCAHSARVNARERKIEIDAAAYIGSKVMRNNVGWEGVQPDSPTQWRWQVMDEIAEQAEARGMEIQLLLSYTAQWAAPKEKQNTGDWLDWNRAAPDLDAWRAYVRAYAERYKGRIHLWEIWNEPDLEGFWKGTTEEYIEMFKAAREVLKEVSPDNIVMSGGFATLQSHPSRAKNPDLQERTMHAVGTLMDAHAVHEHGPFDRFAQVVDGAYATLRASLPEPVPPLFFNETSDHSMHGTERAQAVTLVKKATFARSRGSIGYLWYDLRNDGTSLTDPEHHYGLVTRAMEPKPAYIAFNTLARYMVPRPYLSQLDAGKNRWFFLLGDDKDKLLVFWNDDGSSQNEQVLLRLSGASAAHLIDINGNVSALPMNGELVVVSSGSTPAYLLAEGAQSIEVAGRLAGPPRAFFGAPASEVVVECEFYNPSDATVTVQADWAIPALMTLLEPPVSTLTLAPNSRAVAAARVRLPETEHYAFGTEGKLRVNYNFEGLPYTGRILIPVHYGTITVPADRAGRAADVVLNRQEQLTSFIEADPHMVPLRWKGAEDLSAQVWLRAEADDLVLKVSVVDNVHHQSGPAPDMWQGDSVQVVIAVPEQKGAWEIGLAEDGEGKPLVALWAVPSDWQDCAEQIRLSVEPQGEGRIYTARLPRAALGLTDDILREGFRFNLAVNDNDGTIRAHALQIAPGIVANKSTDAAPYLTFEEIQ